MAEGPIACRQHGCDADAFARYTWPGRDESYACALCAMKVAGIAQTIGLHLQMIPLTIEDHFRAARARAWEEAPLPEDWRCKSCGESFQRDQGGSHAVHAPGCDGNCKSGCPTQCGPVTDAARAGEEW